MWDGVRRTERVWGEMTRSGFVADDRAAPVLAEQVAGRTLTQESLAQQAALSAKATASAANSSAAASATSSATSSAASAADSAARSPGRAP